MKKTGLLFSIYLCIIFISCNKMEESTLQSPDKKITVKFNIKDGQPLYAAEHKGKEVISSSTLGFEFSNNDLFVNNFIIIDIKHQSFNETWEPVWGETSIIRNHYNEMVIDLKEGTKPGRLLSIIFRAYNDGIAFRYIFPGQDSLTDFTVMHEFTQFNMGGNYTAWWIPGDFDSYEHLYRETPVSETMHINTPVTFKANDHCYLSIHEAALVDYPEMTLKKNKESLIYTSDLAPWADGTRAKLRTPFKTPWRTIQVSETPGGLIESYLILNLNEPNKAEDVSWIKPMKYAGIWWGMHIGYYTWHAGERHGASTENAKRYSDFCAANNIPGLLIEGWNTGWESWFSGDNFDYVTPYPDFDLEEVVRYGKEKGVALIGHHETGGQVPGYEKHIDSAFKLYKQLGVHAVKTGYAGKIRPEGENHHGQYMVRHHQMVIEKALENNIMIDAHEPIKPTGLRRTYPNFMTREGVRGMEYNAWSEGNPPGHTCILPFTRMLAGPLDYTPGIFDIMLIKHRNELSKWHDAHDETPKRVHTTLSKQLALYIILYSPLQMLADLPENYEGEAALEFLKEVPVNWDETRVLNGEIGQFVTIARKEGNNWFIGCITNEQQREIEIKLDFLDPEKDYMATVYSDSEKTNLESNPAAYQVQMFPAKMGQIVVMGLVAGGGQVIMIKEL